MIRNFLQRCQKPLETQPSNVQELPPGVRGPLAMHQEACSPSTTPRGNTKEAALNEEVEAVDNGKMFDSGCIL
jgi:hypothetical protein